jgi:two-component system, LuxR family, response regulator FixJ
MSDRIHVIDDDDGVRQGLAFLLEAHGLDAQFHASATAFLADVEDRGACIVTDIRMPEMTGLELVKRLRDEGDQTPVVVITGHGDVPLAVQAMKAGVHDFLEKPFSDAHLVDARREAEARLSSLSPRERDVLAGVVEGKLNKVIAFELDISPRTVEIYRANLMSKTGAHNMAELMRIALAAGL